MSELVLNVGSKNYSSWSMRAWLAMEATGAPYREVLHDIESDAGRARIRQGSPAARVPFLQHGELLVWDSLAICEYLAELFPEARLWPAARDARATARAACAEMHSGFQTLRANCPMNVKRSAPGRGLDVPGVADDARRIQELWRQCRSRFGHDGPFLFGGFTIADCFFAPVAARFRSYAVPLDDSARDYTQALWAHPVVAKWEAAARAENIVIAKYET